MTDVSEAPIQVGYELVCCACGYAQHARLSLAMRCGFNKGYARCIQCDVALNLFVVPDLNGERMDCELFSKAQTRAQSLLVAESETNDDESS